MKLKRGIILQKLGNEYVVFDNKTTTLHELNEVAYKILKKLERDNNKEEIINFLVKTYDVKKVQAEKDLEDFLVELLNKDLIEAEK